jgi:hypothetical protein
MSQQVSIDTVLQKLTYLDAAISTILTKDQLQALYLIERKSLEEAEEMRKLCKASNRYFFEEADPSTNVK